MKTIQITFRNVELEVKGKFIPYAPATYLHPAEGGYFEVYSIHYEGKDITDEMEQYIEEIEILIKEMFL